MREWWANVYFMQGGAVVSASRHGTRDQARRNSFEARVACVHVRLKPEGAPRRYASKWEREAWEADAAGMRQRIRERQEADRRRQREREERFIFAG